MADPTLADVLEIFARHINWSDEGEREIVEAYIGEERATEPNQGDRFELTDDGENAIRDNGEKNE